MLVFNRIIQVVNVLAIVCMVLAVLFSANSIRMAYKNVTIASHRVEREYDEVLNKYKKLSVFILKNSLPQDIKYFNLAGRAMYDLPLVKEIQVGSSKNILIDRDSYKKFINDNIVSTIGCHNTKCIKLFIDNKDVLDKIFKDEQWDYGIVPTKPVKRGMLFQASMSAFLGSNKTIIIISLLCFLILYLSQAIFLFIKNIRLKNINYSLLSALDENKQELLIKSADLDKLYTGSLSIYELVDEYFTHYIHQLISRSTYITGVDLAELLQRIEKIFSYYIVRRKLEIILHTNDVTKSIKSDSELLFIILLNLIFKSISRAKISSIIVIKIIQMQDVINIKIDDIGYEYQPKANNKIQIHMLPDPVLEDLCRKVKIIEVKDTRNGETNTISILMMNSDMGTGEEASDISDGMIKVRFNTL